MARLHGCSGSCLHSGQKRDGRGGRSECEEAGAEAEAKTVMFVLSHTRK